MTTYRLFAKNASGDTLFFTPDADGADYLANLTAKQAFEVMTTRKTGHRWSDDRGRFSRNRIATFRLVHDSGHVETFTPEQAAAAVATPVVTVEPVTETTEQSLALLNGISAELDARHPAQYVTATDPNGVTWYLTNRYGHGVEAGKYFAGAPREFAIVQRPTVSGWTASGPLGVQVRWTQQGTEGFSLATGLVDGWHWRADTEPQPVAMKVPGSITLHRGDERTTVCGLTGVPTGQGGPRCAACFA